MANEISITHRLQIAKGAFQFYFAPSTLQADLASEASAGGNQVIGSTPEALDLNTDVSANGIAYFQNLSTAIPIEIGVTGYTSQAPPGMTQLISLFRLNAGESCIARAATTSIFAQAITSGTNTQAFLSFQLFSP